MEIIAKHLDKSLLKYQIIEGLDTVCAFTGRHISKGYKLTDIISKVFTDFEYIRYDSKYVSEEIALCIQEVIPTAKGGKNSLRSYSYLATEKELRFFKREDTLELLLNIPETPFRMAVSFNFKKHTSYKTALNSSKDNFVVATDLFNVRFDRTEVLRFLPLIQSWYTIIPGKEGSSQQPTFFSKADILGGNADYKKQVVYGLDKFESENEFLKPYRNTQLLTFIVHVLNKKIHVTN